MRLGRSVHRHPGREVRRHTSSHYVTGQGGDKRARGDKRQAASDASGWWKHWERIERIRKRQDSQEEGQEQKLRRKAWNGIQENCRVSLCLLSNNFAWVKERESKSPISK